MRNKLTPKLLIATALLAACAHADVMYTIPNGTAGTTDTKTGSTGSTDTVAGWVDFFLSGCVNGTGCTLDIGIQNTLVVSSENLDQAITGLTFTLSNAGVALAVTGTLQATIHGTGGSSSVTTVTTTGGATGTTGSKGSWTYQANPATTNWGASGSMGKFSLAAGIATGNSKDEIVSTNSLAASTSSFTTARMPAYEGPVYFQITGITGLTTSTDLSNVALLFGVTGTSSKTPEGFFAFPSDSNTDCSSLGYGDCMTGRIGSVPEPMSFLLAGTGILALFLLRRRFLSA